jgi:hypothetical protein
VVSDAAGGTDREEGQKSGGARQEANAAEANAQRSMSNSEGDAKQWSLTSVLGVGCWALDVRRFLIITKKLWQPRKENRPGDREI